MKANNKIQALLFLLIGATGLTFSGINWHNGIAAWIAPVFLLLFVRNTKWRAMWLFFAILAISGGISQTCNNLTHLPVINLINGIGFGVLTIIPYLADKILYRKNNKFYYTLIFPASIAIVEFLASYAICSWGSIAHTQYYFKPFMQISTITGIYGIWFFVSWFASTLVWIIENKNKRKSVKTGAVIFGCLFLSIILGGTIRTISKTEGEKVKVATVISDTDTDELMGIFGELAKDNSMDIPDKLFSGPLTIRSIMDRTIEASGQGAEFIVWNEISLILTQQQKQAIVHEAQDICKQNGNYILLSFIEECKGKNKKPFNNISMLVSPKGEIKWEYKKSFLQPTAEAPIINAGDFKLPVIETQYGKIGNVICADLDMTHYIKQAGKQSVDILLVPAYDWEGITPLHSQMAAVQAIQFGCNIVRSNGKGLSAAFNYKGKEIASLNNFTSEEKIMYAQLPVKTDPTIYSTIGNVFIACCLLFLFFVVFVSFKRTGT